MPAKTAYQGNLDGFCGPYAIVNALARCGVRGQDELMFKTALRTVAKRRLPDLIWEGTTFQDLRRMTKACLDVVQAENEIRASCPFYRRPPSTNREYWQRFDELFDDDLVECAILGVWAPGGHWVVAYREGTNRLVSFVDSDPHFPARRKRRSSLHAGLRRRRASQWLVDRSELIAFRCAAI